MKLHLFTLALLFVLCGNLFSAMIKIDAGQSLRTFEKSPAAINVNYFMDDDTRLNPERPLAEALKKMGVGMLRYPGGEKSDNYLWSAPPYDSPKPTFAIKTGENWQSQNPKLSSDGIHPLPTAMDFDEFMEVCEAVGAEAMIVVSGDAQFNKEGDSPPTRGDLIENATTWIRYANITHNHGIKYWVVGNESWAKSAYYRPTCTPEEYAEDFVHFAKAMKAVDPTITVVANTSGKWIDTLMEIAGDYVDAVSISYYPSGQWEEGYETFRTKKDELIQLEQIVESIGDRPIRIIIAEYNAVDFFEVWMDRNNALGHALINFQTLGDFLKIEQVEDAFLWNTRWINNEEQPQHIFDALDANGHLNATGKALSLWGNHHLEQLVYAENSGFVRTFATIDKTGKQMNIFLLNKDYDTHPVSLTVENFPPIKSEAFKLSEVRFEGSSRDDKFPTITSYSESTASIDGSTIQLELDPLSVRILQLRIK